MDEEGSKTHERMKAPVRRERMSPTGMRMKPTTYSNAKVSLREMSD